MNTKSRLHHSLAAGIVLVCASNLAVTPAYADSLGPPKVRIRYADLNLSTASGAKILYERIVSASYDVCQDFDRDSRDNAAPPRALQTCLREVIAEVVSKINKPGLYTVYNARNKRQLPDKILTAESPK